MEVVGHTTSMTKFRKATWMSKQINSNQSDRVNMDLALNSNRKMLNKKY